ncbi:MAG: ABC transporter ATP-binding protein [Bacteroidales bacterium]|jgi:ABC-type multidrug transport system ATPase subunit|nr:ABC transporter ATP-binding protein [Bacteroidales bacterium]
MESVRITGLSKSYGKVRALDSISLSVEKGELFGFIGPDGSGKTTLFRILTTLLLPDSGQATVEGFDTVKEYRQIRKIAGYMPGRFSLYQDLSVEENLKFFASIFKTTIQENYYLIRDIYSQIEPFKNRPAGKLSGGMKQKLALSCALIHKPAVLFLDEPTTGVDAVSRKEFWDMLARLKKEGITILVSTPYMDEAGRCDRVALIQQGKILGIDTPQGIVGAYTDKLLAVKSSGMYQLLFDVQAFPQTIRAYRSGEFIHCSVKDYDAGDELRDFLAGQGHEMLEVRKISPDVEDCFLALMTNDRSFGTSPSVQATND